MTAAEAAAAASPPAAAAAQEQEHGRVGATDAEPSRGPLGEGVRAQQTSPPGPSATGAVLPPVDGDLWPPPRLPDRDAYLTLLLALLLEAVVPSLQCYWGILIALRVSPASSDKPYAFTLTDLRNSGLLWTPVLFTASWSAADPWSETLGVVHGHPRLSSLVGSVLLVGGLLMATLGALVAPSSSLLPLLTGVSAGIASGVGASLLFRSSRLVLGQRWGAAGAAGAAGAVGARSGLPLGPLEARRFLRALGLTMAPLVALSLSQQFCPGGALLVAFLSTLPTAAAPFLLSLPRQQRQLMQTPSAYKRLKDMGWRLSSVQPDADTRTEVSDDGGSDHGDDDVASGVQQAGAAAAPPVTAQQQAASTLPGVAATTTTRTTVVAEVHRDGSGEVQQPGLSRLSAAATARMTLTPERDDARAAAARTVQSREPGNEGATTAPPPQPLYGEGGAWNLAYSFDCDGDDDIELFVRRKTPGRGVWSAWRPMLRGCRADLRPVAHPAFHLSLYTLSCCRLANLALPVLLPALSLVELGPRSRAHIMAALPAVAGVGAMLFGLTLLLEASWEVAADADLSDTRPRARKRFLSAVSAMTAAGFLLLSWGRTQWWLMLGCLAAGYGSAAATWAQSYASKDAMGGATAYRAQPLLCACSGLAVVCATALCNWELASCMAVLAGMFTALSGLWLVQPYLSRFC